jgi:hypothetical protein
MSFLVKPVGSLTSAIHRAAGMGTTVNASINNTMSATVSWFISPSHVFVSDPTATRRLHKARR